MTAFDPGELQQALSRSAATLIARETDDDLESVLTRLCAAAVANVPGADHAGLTMTARDGTLSSHGVSNPVIAELDRLQAELSEGPCVDTMRAGTSTTVLVDDFADEDQRWPKFTKAALESGVHGLLSFAMAPVDASPGALNLYSATPRAFGAGDQAVAGAFAMQAAVAYYGARKIEGLSTAIATRDVIGQAKGILMERFGLDAEAAFDLLVRSSQDTNLKLVDVAGWLTDEVASGRARAEPAPEAGPPRTGPRSARDRDRPTGR